MPDGERKNWVAFIEGEVVNFFVNNELEKMNLEDGYGNKAKLSKQKNGEINIEYTYKTTV